MSIYNHNKYDSAFPKLIDALKKRQITVYRLGKMTGIHLPSLYSVLAGKMDIYPGWKKRIAEALEMDEEELFPDHDNGEEV